MKLLFSFFIVMLFITEWKTQNEQGYVLKYTQADQANLTEYTRLIKQGIDSVQKFTGKKFKNEFTVIIHPDRASLDASWQQYPGMADFKSQCWMVASGIATTLEMISPKTWDSTSCEHSYSNQIKTAQLITHELFHVYHGQLNVSPDFGDTENIDWFVEGFATYASGQCSKKRLEEVKVNINNNTIPSSLNDFWTGKQKYGLSGSVIKFIDYKFGRAKLLELLPFNKKSEILKKLNINEEQLMTEWKAYMLAL